MEDRRIIDIDDIETFNHGCEGFRALLYGRPFEWHVFDGSPESLPEAGMDRRVIVFMGTNHYRKDGIFDSRNCDRHMITHYTGIPFPPNPSAGFGVWYESDTHPIIGDMWAYLPVPSYEERAEALKQEIEIEINL